MSKQTDFLKFINENYEFKGDSIVFGAGMLGEETVTNALVKVPLKTINRHGLIAGATGTGKTKTLQGFAESLSLNGVPVLLMDIKGDLSGLAKPSQGHPKIDERHAAIGYPFKAQSFPVEMLTLSNQEGVRLRATISEFGPVLLSRILEINDTQSGIIAIIFKYCDDHNIPLLDLKDFKKMLQFITQEGKAEIEGEYGRISTSSTGSILRKIIELEQQGAELFFGEESFDVQDLVRIDDEGKGVISILRLTDIQDKPKLFSTFMLQLLAEVYNTFPEQGDTGRPELVIFIDEAHLIFSEASKSLLDQIENIVKLIRSKGVGIYFVTQNPKDVPQDILAQLGLKVQHALRAFTANDRKAIKMAAENFPDSEYYKTEEVLTQMGIGEALITALNEKGIPTPLARTMLCAPMSRMDILTEDELKEVINKSKLREKYNKQIDRESAFEILSKKINLIQEEVTQKEKRIEEEKYERKTTTRSTAMNPVIKVLTSATFIRGVMGILNKVMK